MTQVDEKQEAHQIMEACRKALFERYFDLCEDFQEVMPPYEFGYALIEITVKMLMDTAPGHKVALETIRVATESGIKWHIEEREEKKGEE